MKWIKIKLGDERIITKFLLFPRNINDTTKWLEKVSFRQQYIRSSYNDGFSDHYYNTWVDMEWEENNET